MNFLEETLHYSSTRCWTTSVIILFGVCDNGNEVYSSISLGDITYCILYTLAIAKVYVFFISIIVTVQTSQQSSSKCKLFELLYKYMAHLSIEITTCPEEIDDHADVDTVEEVKQDVQGQHAGVGR